MQQIFAVKGGYLLVVAGYNKTITQTQDQYSRLSPTLVSVQFLLKMRHSKNIPKFLSTILLTPILLCMECLRTGKGVKK
jgi:hypothetical protein